ncbi:MAG: D-glycerate dehydrogenase [Litorilinea sp.]
MPYFVLTDVELSPAMLEMLDGKCTVEVWAGTATPDATLARAEGLFTYGHPPVDGALMDRMSNLRVISNFGVGVDHINLENAHTRGLPVGNTPGLVDGATADMTFALLMAVARNVVTGDHYARSPEFTSYDPNILHGYEVYGATLGIVGMGAIGQQVAKRARGFDMPILYHNRKRNPQAERELNATYATLPDLLAQADYVTLNVPLTTETYHLIGRDELRQMKSTAFLINAARGGVVDHDALHTALTEGWIAGAAIDVTEPEPLPRDHPLLQLENLVIAPHLGSATRQTRHNMARRSIDNLIAGLEGQPLLNRVA